MSHHFDTPTAIEDGRLNLGGPVRVPGIACHVWDTIGTQSAGWQAA
jgi:hypothetical protein